MLRLRRYKYYLAVLVMLAALAAPFSSQTSTRTAVYLSYDEARPALQALNEILPAELKRKDSDELMAAWPSYLKRRDAEIRDRLALGDEDSLVNLLLFGTSYTKQQRISPRQIAERAQPNNQASSSAQDAALPLSKILQTRVDDMIRGLVAPAQNERLLFARGLLVDRSGHDLSTAQGRLRLKEFLLASVGRLLNEQASYARTLAAARLLGDPTEEFSVRSRLYQSRGLSSDTTLLPNFGLEESLKAMRDRGLIKAGDVRRVAVIGPGLDFTDKQDGYDFYPLQTIQPFAIIDSLLRLGLAHTNLLQVTTFDISPRVNDHLARAKQRAQRGASYVVQLPRDPGARWKPDAIRYWQQFGDRIGTAAIPVGIPANVGELKLRAVRIQPAVVSLLTPVDLNIVLQRPDLGPNERFDLIIATNIFVYYDTFEQSLAMLNIERMLRPGGFLLSNNALLELPFCRVRSVDYLTVTYSDRPDDGDHIVWYQRSAD